MECSSEGGEVGQRRGNRRGVGVEKRRVEGV